VAAPVAQAADDALLAADLPVTETTPPTDEAREPSRRRRRRGGRGRSEGRTEETGAPLNEDGLNEDSLGDDAPTDDAVATAPVAAEPAAQPDVAEPAVTAAARPWWEDGAPAATPPAQAVPVALAQPLSPPPVTEAPQPVAQAQPEPAPVPVPAPAPLPTPPFVLAAAELARIAEGAGLTWVQSDPTKVAEVQAAIAAEPKPVHVPRERPPLVALDDGPLVLVETRKDLSQIRLPFDV